MVFRLSNVRWIYCKKCIFSAFSSKFMLHRTSWWLNRWSRINALCISWSFSHKNQSLKYWELAVLKISVFWVARMGRDFYDYCGLQPIITHPQTFLAGLQYGVCLYLSLHYSFQPIVQVVWNTLCRCNLEQTLQNWSTACFKFSKDGLAYIQLWSYKLQV